jgi:hypothetical protein
MNTEPHYFKGLSVISMMTVWLAFLSTCRAIRRPVQLAFYYSIAHSALSLALNLTFFAASKFRIALPCLEGTTSQLILPVHFSSFRVGCSPDTQLDTPLNAVFLFPFLFVKHETIIAQWRFT